MNWSSRYDLPLPIDLERLKDIKEGRCFTSLFLNLDRRRDSTEKPLSGSTTRTTSLFFLYFFHLSAFFTCPFFTSNLCLESGKKNRGGLYKKSFHKKLDYGNCSKSIKNVCCTIKKAVIIHIVLSFTSKQTKHTTTPSFTHLQCF